ncbi:MAG: biotin--[acetyl-CoA-carboxylase] ligase [Candidatus Eremiobacterota bacterium]
MEAHWNELESVDSTNRVAEEAARSGSPEGTVVLARRQTAGRGRRYHTWHSPEGGLWFSVVLRPPRVEGLSLLAGLACVGALAELGVPTELRWPNDLYARDRKLAGILVESRLLGTRPEYAVVGIGLNVNNTDFPPDVPGISLKELAGRELDRHQVLRGILRRLEADLEAYGREGLAPFLGRLRAAMGMPDRVVQIFLDEGPRTARPVDLEPDGTLILEDGTRLTSVEQVRPA